MRLPWILLPILAQGALGALFKEQPPGELVVHRGQEVELTCITNEDVSCAWKLETPLLGISGFLSSRIPPNVDITAKDPNSARDCTIILRNVDERYNGKYKCSPYTDKGGQEDSSGTELIIAQKPKRVHYLGEVASGFPLPAASGETTTVQCMAEMARPKAEILWFLGNTQLYQEIDVQDTPVNNTGLWNTVSTLTYEFRKEDNGKNLRCVAVHAGYDKNDVDDQEARETAVEVDVQFAPYRPGGNNIGKVYGFTAGQLGEMTVNFTANPAPTDFFWRIGDEVRVPQRATALLDRRFTSGALIIKNATLGMYAVKLTIDPVQMEDQSKQFVLQLENSVGTTELQFQIGTGAPPPPEAALGATIGGIVAAVVVLAIIIGVVVFGRSRGKWCFAGKGKDTTDKPAPRRPLKAPRPSASASNVNRTGGGGSAGAGAPRRNSLPADARRRSSRIAGGGGKSGMPMLSLAALKKSMSSRPNRLRHGVDDGSVEVGLEEVTYVGGETAAGEREGSEEAPQQMVRQGSPVPVPEPAAEEPAAVAQPAEQSTVDIPELEAPPRAPVYSAARPAEADLSEMPKTVPEPIAPILFPTSQPPAAMSSPMSSEVSSPASSLGPPQYPRAGRPLPQPVGPPTASPSVSSGQQRPSQMGPSAARQMGPVGNGTQSGQPGVHPSMGPRGSEPADWRGRDQNLGSGPIGPGVYTNTAAPALPERNPVTPWQQPAAGRQRGAIALPPDSPGFSEAPAVGLPPAAYREELGIPFPPSDAVVRRPGPPLPPKNRPQSQVPAGAVRVLPGSLQSDLTNRFPSSPSLLDPRGDGSAV